jgi:hypothetical protein
MLTNNLKVQVDLPTWEWMRFTPTTSTAVSSAATAKLQGTRFIYYQVSGTLSRYDTYSDSWHQLTNMTGFSTPTIMNANAISSVMGHPGRAIGSGGGNNTMQLAGLWGKAMVGYKIRITGGTGQGQERTITAISNPTIHERGTITTGGTQSIVDASTGVSLKQWKLNQWRDYQIRVDYGTGRTQLRPLLSNTINSLVWSDATQTTVNPWAQPLSNISFTASSQYVIESHIITVDENWETNPDNTSTFMVMSGGIWNVTQGTTATPFFSLSYYDILADQWYGKSTQSGLKTVVFLAGSDLSLEVMTEVPSTITTGTATSATTNTLTNTGVTMIANQYKNQNLIITGGTGIGQTKQILNHTSTAFTICGTWTTIPDSTSTYSVSGGIIFSEKANGGGARYITPTATLTDMQYANFECRIVAGTGWGQTRGILSNSTTRINLVRDWDTAPDNTSVYQIYRDNGKLYLIGGNDATMYQYSIDHDQWTTARQLDNGQVNQLAARRTGSWPYALTSITRSATGLKSITGVATAGIGYNINDLLTINAQGGIARVTGVDSVGGVTSVSLEYPGTGYASGAKAVVASPLGGVGCTLTIGVGDIDFTALCVTPTLHDFTIGDTVTISGCSGTGAATFNGAKTVIGVLAGGLGFSYALGADPGAATATIPISPSTTVLVDVTKNWTIDEHKGKLIQFSNNPIFAGLAQARRIISNTATSITWTLAMPASTPANGTWRYVMTKPNAFGTEITNDLRIGGGNEGWATGTHSTTTLQDTTKNWEVNVIPKGTQKFVRITEGTGVGSEILVISNTSNTLTYATQTFTPDATTRYIIMDAFGTATGAGAITTLTSAPTAGGSGYAVGDVLNITGGSAQARVLSVSTGAVTALQLMYGGVSGYTVITGVATTASTGTGINCTVAVAAISAIGSTTVLTDTSKNWDLNCWVNKRVRFMTGTSQGNEYIITANTANTLTYALGTAPDVSTVYCILESSPRAYGIHLDNIVGSTDTTLNHKYMYAFTGTGTVELSRYDITDEHWDLMSYFPQFETMTTGAMYAYDGKDRIYVHLSTTLGLTGRIMYYDLTKNVMVPASTVPYGHSTAVSGNRMELITTADGLQYLYVFRHTGQELWRLLINF